MAVDSHCPRGGQALTEGEVSLRAAIENMLEPFVIFEALRGVDGRIVDFTVSYANAACRDLLQVSLEETQGKSLLGLLPQLQINGLFARFCHVVETGEPLSIDNFEFEDTFQDSARTTPLDVRAIRVGMGGLAVNWRSLTDHRRRQADLAEVQRSLIDSVEKERRQLAHLLHDGPVQDLYAIDFQLHAIQWQCGDTQTQDGLNQVQDQLHQVINTLLAAVGQLRPFSLSPFGLKAAILSHLDKFKANHPEITVETDLDDDQDLLPQETRLGLYRTYQHAINNIECHARATHIAVTLKVDACQVLLRIEDNGSGFMLPERLVTLARSGHLGITNAVNQMARLGGQLHIQSGLGEGTVVTASLPIKKE